MADINESGLRTFVAGEALEMHRRVKLNPGATTVVYSDAEDWIGVTEGSEAVANGAQVLVRMKTHPGTFKLTCSAAVAAGAAVYGTADGKIDDAWGSNAQLVGRALEAGSGDGAKIEVMPEFGKAELLYSIIAQSAAGGTSTAAEFTFDNGTFTIPAGEIREGDLYRITARGILTNTNGADTFTGRLYFGTELVASTPAPDAVDNDIFAIVADIVIREKSATGKLVATGLVYNDALAAGLATPFVLEEATEDLTGAIAISLRGIFSASSAGNAARLRQFTVERIRK
jgi:hypothetical protein